MNVVKYAKHLLQRHPDGSGMNVTADDATHEMIDAYCPQCGGPTLLRRILDQRVHCPECEPNRGRR